MLYFPIYLTLEEAQVICLWRWGRR